MNKILRFVGIGFITLLYCFAIGIVDIASGNSNRPINFDIDQQSYFTQVKTNLCCHKSQTEELVNNINNVPSTNVKDRFKRISIIIENSLRVFESKYSQYCFYYDDLLIRYRKYNFLFPFHYFW